jgi:DNA segregation ATPase FtsK/SpoIIIE, S-DNA-T family
MKKGFKRETPPAPPAVIKPEPIALLTPLKTPPPEGKSPWLVIIGVVVIGIILGIVVVSYASGARTFTGAGSVMPVVGIGGIGMMMFGGRMFGGGSGQQMTRGKLDALRARFMLVLDELRERIGYAADNLDVNYRWYHPPVATLAAAAGGPQMWSRSPSGTDTWFGVVRVGVGMTSLVEGGAVTFTEPTDMPTEVEMEPATGTALEEFVRAQSVAYGTPALLSLLVEPGYRLEGPRDLALGLMRAMVAQMVFAHGPDHLRLVVVTDDVDEWEWVKWLPHNGDGRKADAVGPARMVYRSVQEFADDHLTDAVLRAGAFEPRHAAVRDAIAPLPHTVVISDVAAGGWFSVMTADGLAGWTFFDLHGGMPCCQDRNGARLLRLTEGGDIEAVPRDVVTWSAIGQEGATFFAVADQLGRDDAEEFAALLCRWRIAEPYEATGDEAPGFHRPRAILPYYGIDDPAKVDYRKLWAKTNINSPDSMRVPFANRHDNGELLLLDLKDMNNGGDGPHGVMSGTTGSGKTTALRTLNLGLMLGHAPWDLQFVLADCKGGAGVKPFEHTPHVAHVITDLEDDQMLMDRFVDALWGEIARRKAICNAAGADDADEYNLIRAERAREGEQLPPLPRLLVELDEFAEAFRIKPDIPQVLEQIGRQGRSLWVHMLLASQEITTHAEKLLNNVHYRIVLRQNTATSASAAGVPAAVNLPREVGVGYFRVGSAEDLVRFRAESLWRDYHKPGTESDEAIASGESADFLPPQLFTTAWAPLPERVEVVEPATLEPLESVEEDDEGNALRKPTVGRVMLDQLREIDFEPYRLWLPPLNRPRALDDIVEMYLGRPWDVDYAATPNLVFPVGVIDRPFKHDQQPLLIEAYGDGTNQLVIGTTQSGKTVALQTAICAAAMTHTPEQVQFYVLALGGSSVGTVEGLPHVGGVAYGIDEDGVRRTISEMMELLGRRQRSFPACGVKSMEDFRQRKFGGAPGEVPDDPYGDVFLVIDNFQALTGQASTIRNKDMLADHIQKLITEGGSYGIHVLTSVQRDINLPPQTRGSFPKRIELKLTGAEDARLVRGRLSDAVPPGKPGRGMVAQNYPRLGTEPTGLHTLIARPALRSTGDEVFDSASIVDAVRRVAARYRPAPPVRRLPNKIELPDLRRLAAQRGHSGLAWGIDELDHLVGLDTKTSPFLVITGREDCGRTNAVAAIMSEIERVYAPGSTSALAAADPDDARPRAQVWLVNPARELLRVLGSDYLERFTYRPDEVLGLARDLAAILNARLPESGLGVEASLNSTWTGPEIFLVVDDAERLPYGMDAPLRDLMSAANAAGDVGFRVIYARRFGGWSGAERMDPLLSTMKQANAQLLVMDSDMEEGFVRGRWRGHSMPVGRGFLMSTADSGLYVQVGRVSADQKEI